MMKANTLVTISTLLTTPLLAQSTLNDVTINNCSIQVEDDRFVVTAEIDLSRLELPSCGAVLIAPVLTCSSDDVPIELPGVAVYTRSRYYECLRNEALLGGYGTESFMVSKKPNVYYYRYKYPYQSSADYNAEVQFKRHLVGCGGIDLEQMGKDTYAYRDPVARPAVFTPQFMYVTPQDQEVVKVRQTSGQAYIVFDVDKVDIQESRANNAAELRKIRASIDSVRNNQYYKIRKMTLTGYASPDGPYEKNKTLAQGRTEVMSEYLRGIYSFDRSLLRVNSVPEDWKGLRELIASSTLLANQSKLLQIIDNPALNFDQKEAKIKQFAADYDIMRTEILPRLRHTDYVIEYEVSRFSSAEECLQQYRLQPANLSLEEFYKCTEGLDGGSALFLEIWETALRYYPEDPIANLNVANAAMVNGKYEEAAKALQKAGDSAQANYARGNLAALQGRYDDAERYFTSCKSLPEAQSALERLQGLLHDVSGRR